MDRARSAFVLCFEPKPSELPRIHRRRSLRHQTRRRGRLGERYDITNRITTGHQHHHPIEPEGDPTVRRHAVAEGFEEKAEA